MRDAVLQDDIAPFPTPDAFAMLEADLGRPVRSLFSAISPAPVAAASLGQVYRATLAANGDEVAVKVQRPHLLPTIALDIFILRNAAKALRRARRLNSNLPSLIDDWASSIYREMSYRNELANADEFRSLFSHYYEVRRRRQVGPATAGAAACGHGPCGHGSAVSECLEIMREGYRHSSLVQSWSSCSSTISPGNQPA